MKRWRVDAGSPVPPELARYREEEWALPEAWYAARDAWRDAGGSLPFLAERGPDVPFDGTEI